MADDLGDSLSAIQRRYGQPIVKLLVDIQETKIKDPKSAEFMQALECLRFPNQSNFPDSNPSIILERETINTIDEKGYVAVSYTWQHPPGLEQYGKHLVRSRPCEGRGFLPSKVRDSVFERVQKYMKFWDMKYLWIDQECIMQEEGEEKNIAMQAMDLVYGRSKHPVGLLYQPILSIAELEILAGLLKGKFIYTCESGFKLSPRLTHENLCEILELLGTIVSDIWWTRAWTYQENYRGGINMDFLIPHCISTEDYRDDHVSLFGDIRGEVVLNSTIFNEAATAFCLAFDDPPDRLIKTKELVLERARKYTLLPELDLAARSMTPFIIVDVEKRQLRDSVDRLAIIANCCEYAVRLDPTQLARKGYSTSLAILVLFLLNGEILYNGNYQKNRDLSEHKMTEFLNVQAFNKFTPPQSEPGLTYNKGCRFNDVQLTEHGIRTKGHLWKLSRRIETSRFPRRPRNIPRRPRKADVQDSLIFLAGVVKEMGYTPLYDDIILFLEDIDVPQAPISFSKEYQIKMAEELAIAVSEGSSLRLGLLWDPHGDDDEHSPYCGIFICNQSRSDNSPYYVFTASREKESDIGKDLWNDIDRHVSLEVSYTRGCPPNLYTRRWIHGLCFFYGCSRMEVNFPWPSVLTQL